MKYLLLLLLLAGCGVPQPVSELDQLYQDESALESEISDLKKRLRESADDDDIEDLEDEIDDLEDRLRRVKNQETVAESDSPFCNRTKEVRFEIKEILNSNTATRTSVPHRRDVSPIDRCGQVTNYMLTQITGTISLTTVKKFRSGDLHGLTKATINLPDLRSYPRGLFDEDTEASKVQVEDTPLEAGQISEFNTALGTAPTGTSPCLTEDEQEDFEKFHKDAMYEAKKYTLYEHFKDDFHTGAEKYKDAWTKHKAFKGCKHYNSIDWEG